MDLPLFDNPERLLDQLLNELENRPEMSTIAISRKSVNTVTVLRSFYGEVPTAIGRERFLRYSLVFLHSNWPANIVWSFPSLDDYNVAWAALRSYYNLHWQTKQKILRCLARLGEHLVFKCIYPMMARPGSAPPSGETTQPRSPDLRERVLFRDGHRSVVTGAFQLEEGERRQQSDFIDDDEVSLETNPSGFSNLEVAHIIPHALEWRDNVDETTVLLRLNIHAILDMFCPGTMGKYAGGAIDLPENAMAMDLPSHKLFGDLRVYFEPIQDSPTGYVIRHVKGSSSLLPQFPLSINFRSVTNIALPDSNLLAIHRACALIAHASGAAEASAQFFRDLEDGTVEEDGSTPLGNLVAHRLTLDQHSMANQQDHRAMGHCLS